MIKRELTKQIDKLKKGFPVIAITGPRQSGKTTLARAAFPKYEYFNLEDPDVLTAVENDPSGFIHTHNKYIVIDEVQRLPILLSYMQAISDENKIPGRFVISGSQNLLLADKVNQSLAGRAAYLKLFPLSYSELVSAQKTRQTLLEQMFYGFYPALYDTAVDPISYYNQYIATYVERDVKQISNISSLSNFRKFIMLLAGRIGQVVDKTALANDVGVSSTTIEEWLSILESSYLIIRLQPYYNNFGKRYIKSPKIYFTDTGLACRLLGITKPSELEQHYLRGGLFENLVIMEVQKYIENTGNPAKCYYFRDSNQKEVDLVIDLGQRQIPVEIKSSATFSTDFTLGLDYWRSIGSDNDSNTNEFGYVVYTGRTFGVKTNRVINYQDLSEIFAEM